MSTDETVAASSLVAFFKTRGLSQSHRQTFTLQRIAKRNYYYFFKA